MLARQKQLGQNLARFLGAMVHDNPRIGYEVGRANKSDGQSESSNHAANHSRGADVGSNERGTFLEEVVKCRPELLQLIQLPRQSVGFCRMQSCRRCQIAQELPMGLDSVLFTSQPT